MLSDIKKDIALLANEQKAKILQGFFKTGKGEYGEGDIFLGLTVPASRKIAIKFKDLLFEDLQNLLPSKIHEERLIALLILVSQFQRGDAQQRKAVYNFYLKHTKCVNNWDLVDLSADKIIGNYLLYKPRNMLVKFAKSENLWEKRIAMISTYAFIKKGEHKTTFEIAEILLHDTHDLIQKAVGWMLREVGKRVSQEAEIEFLNKHYHTMPRTSLRYAIERFPEKLRKKYLNKQNKLKLIE